MDYHEAKETYSRIGLLRGYGSLQSYWTTTRLWTLTVVLYYYRYEVLESNPDIEDVARQGKLCSFYEKFNQISKGEFKNVKNYTRIELKLHSKRVEKM